jgi:hypothetical protein
MCREILNTCIRNTEEAEKAAHVSDGLRSPASNRGLGKGVWNMIQESELAKSIRQGGGLKVGGYSPCMISLLMILKNNAEIISRAYTLLSQIENSVNSPRSISVASSGASSPTLMSPMDQDLVQQVKATVDEITEKVQTTTDVVLLEELLGLCDKLNSAVAQLSSAPSSRSLHGLGLNIPSAVISSTEGDALHEKPADLSEDDTPLTPKVDKGKGRAEPEPEEPEKVLSPTFMITESEDEDEDDNRFLGEEDQINVPSPVVRWVIIQTRYRHTLIMSKGRKFGLKKKEKSFEKVLSFLDLKRWRESTLAKTSVVR